MNAQNYREEALEDFRDVLLEAKEYILDGGWLDEMDDLANLIETRKSHLAKRTCVVRRLKAVLEEEAQEAAMVIMVYDFVARKDGDVLNFLTASIKQSLQYLNDSSMDLILDCFHIDNVSTIFELPSILSKACRPHIAKKKRRCEGTPPCLWKVAYVYVLGRLAIDDLQQTPFSFSLKEWSLKIKSLMDKPLQTSRAAASGMTLFKLDWIVELLQNNEPPPIGLTLKNVVDELVASHYK